MSSYKLCSVGGAITWGQDVLIIYFLSLQIYIFNIISDEAPSISNSIKDSMNIKSFVPSIDCVSGD